jgi:uncharacterized protein YceH (UPF0502 family)
MSNCVVNSILARALVDARFRAELERDPSSALAWPGVPATVREAFGQMDFARLRGFRGLITKVQHNYLWEAFPYTLTLLRELKLELQVFERYSERHQALRANVSATRNTKIVYFLDHLQGYVERYTPPHGALLLAMLRHERTSWELSADAAQLSEPSPEQDTDALPRLSAREFGRLVPRIRGALRIQRFAYDPGVIAHALATGRPSVQDIGRKASIIAYWLRDRSDRVHLFRPDEFTASVLERVDGRRSVAAVAKRAGQTVSVLKGFFASAAEQGLVSLSSPPAGGCSHEDCVCPELPLRRGIGHRRALPVPASGPDLTDCGR